MSVSVWSPWSGCHVKPFSPCCKHNRTHTLTLTGSTHKHIHTNKNHTNTYAQIHAYTHIDAHKHTKYKHNHANIRTNTHIQAHTNIYAHTHKVKTQLLKRDKPVHVSGQIVYTEGRRVGEVENKIKATDIEENCTLCKNGQW